MLEQILSFIVDFQGAFVAMFIIAILRKSISKLFERMTTFKMKLPTGFETSIEAKLEVDKEFPITNEIGLELPRQLDSGQDELSDKIESESTGDWVDQINQALKGKDTTGAKEIFQKVMESEKDLASNSWMEGWFLNRLFSEGGDSSALNDLKGRLFQSTDVAIREDFLWWLILSLKTIKDYSSLVDILNSELKQSEDNKYTDFVTIKLSQILIATEKKDEALLLLTDRLNEILTDDDRSDIYRAIADAEKAKDNNVMQALCLEKNAQFKSTDTSILFEAAFAEAEAGLDIMAFSNYDTMLTIAPDDEGVLNNQAVQYSKFDLPIKSIELYKKASEGGNTLAMANLAHQMMDVGLIVEAEELLDKASRLENPHENVFEAKSTIPTKRKNEEDRDDQLKEKAIRYRDHLRKYTEAYYLKPKENVFAGVWKDQYDQTFTISPDHNKIEVEWETNSSSNMDVICKLSGSIVNSSGIFNYSTKPAHQGETLSYYMQLLNESYKCYAYLSNNMNVINLISLNSTTDFFLTISRVKK